MANAMLRARPDAGQSALYKWLMAVLVTVVCGFAAEAGRPDGETVAGRIARSHRIVREGSWRGFRCTEFEFRGHAACVVEPTVTVATGRPWTWTMQWWNAFVDRTGVLNLLRQGYHHVWIDLFATRMDDAGVAVAADFHRFLVDELGFAPKANLVGMSWGGFFSTRYAAAHPDSVARIYYDAPLMNFDGFGKPSTGRIGGWADNLPPDGKWSDDPRMPVNMAERIAAAKIPIYVLYGGQDQTVPPALNCELFLARFKAAGGEATVEKRALFGHHPHGLDPDKTDPIVRFFNGGRK